MEMVFCRIDDKSNMNDVVLFLEIEEKDIILLIIVCLMGFFKFNDFKISVLLFVISIFFEDEFSMVLCLFGLNVFFKIFFKVL